MHTQSHDENDNQQQGYPFPFYFPFISVHFLLLFDRRTKKHRGMFGRRQKKRGHKSKTYNLISGERGIRTPGTSQYNGFQDRRNRPLCHLSKPLFQECLFSKAMQRYDYFLNLQVFCLKFSILFFTFATIKETRT